MRYEQLVQERVRNTRIPEEDQQVVIDSDIY